MKVQKVPFDWENPIKTRTRKLSCPCCIRIQTTDATTALITANDIPSLDILQIPALEFSPLITSTGYYPSNILRKRYMKVSSMPWA